jgi:hypothetical protein
MIKVHYTAGGQEYRSSLASFLTQGKVPSTRIMKYLISVTELLIRKGVFGVNDLDELARAYEVYVTVHDIEITHPTETIDVTPKSITNGES